MPAPTTYQPPTAPDADIFARVERDRVSAAPWAAFIFAPCDNVADASNTFGLPLYAPRGPVYTLYLDSANPLALQRMAQMEQDGRAMCAAGKLVDDMEATLAYQLLAECVALNSTAAILDQLGVEVRGENPFPP